MNLEIYKITIGQRGVEESYVFKYISLTNECINVKNHLIEIVRESFTLNSSEEVIKVEKINIENFAETKQADDFINNIIK